MPSIPGYTWDENAARYRSVTTGKFVSPTTIRRWLDRALLSQSKLAAVLANQLRRRTITVEAFDLEMRTIIKNVQLFSAAIGRGGFPQMTSADYGAVGARVRDQFVFLNKFTEALRAGDVALDGAFIARVKSYAEAGRTVFEVMHRKVNDAAEKTEESNILDDDPRVQHCPECPALTARGWVPIGTMPVPGERVCRIYCRCRMAYR